MKIGDRVRWTSSNTTKQGVIEAVVPVNMRPFEIGYPAAGGGGYGRDHESFIVRARKLTNSGCEYGTRAVFWPRVSMLELVKPTIPESALRPTAEEERAAIVAFIRGFDPDDEFCEIPDLAAIATMIEGNMHRCSCMEICGEDPACLVHKDDPA